MTLNQQDEQDEFDALVNAGNSASIDKAIVGPSTQPWSSPRPKPASVRYRELKKLTPTQAAKEYEDGARAASLY